MPEQEQPHFRVEMHTIPSWNDFLGIVRHQGQAQGMIEKWRKKGKEVALRAAKPQGFFVEEWVEHTVSKTGKQGQIVHHHIAPHIITRPCRLVLRLWRPNRTRYDVFSPFIKPIIDGFTDAGVFPDDNTDYVPCWTTRFEGVDPDIKLSPEARERRRNARKTTKRRSDPTPCRWWFDFHLLP